MLRKTHRSAWILAGACSAVIFLTLYLLQAPDLSDPAYLQGTVLIGFILFAVTSFTFYSLIARSDPRYYGLGGLVGWVLIGLLMAVSMWWVESIYPSTFGMIGVAVIGFIFFRWLVFWLVWQAQRLFKQT